MQARTEGEQDSYYIAVGMFEMLSGGIFIARGCRGVK